MKNGYIFLLIILSMGELFAQETKKIKLEEKIEPVTKEDKRIEQWRKTIENNGLKSFFFEGYWFVLDENKKYLKGCRQEISIKDYPSFVLSSKKPDEIKEKAQILAGNYKIHFMPHDDDIDRVLQDIFTELKNNSDLQNTVAYLKVYKNYPKTWQDAKNNQRVFPRIVVYPVTGKKNAQKALNILYKKFNAFNGLDIAPSFNAKVTSLIYVAQGDADFKGDFYKEYYEQPHRIYYKLKEIPPVEPDEDHYLRHPETGKPLMSIK